MLNLVITGAAGRMGRTLTGMISASEDLTLAGAVETKGNPTVGRDAGELAGCGALGVAVTDDLGPALEKADVLIDFSSIEGTLSNVKTCVEKKTAVVIGTTGLDDKAVAVVKAAGEKIPVVFAPNMSLGMNLLFKLVEQTAEILGGNYDVEIVEAHHHNKKDAPSGTALRLAQSAADALGRTKEDYVCGREGIVGARKKNEIGILAVRAGDIVGEHTVMFAGPGERLELTHRAHTRDTFASGAITAARWLADKKAGFYTMFNVLGLE